MLVTEPTTSASGTHAQPSTTPVPELKTAASLAATTALLAACGGGDGPDASASANAETSPIMADLALDAKPASDAEAARFLQQAQFSSTKAEIANLRLGSYAQWLTQQFTAVQGQSGWDCPSSSWWP